MNRKSRCTWSLLEFNHLLVGEDAAVVDDAHAVPCLTVGAHSRLSDPAPVYLNRVGLLANIAREEGWGRQ